jgi:hypothetical protein
MPQLMISDPIFSRLQKHAVPLVDTIETVIARALDALEAAGSKSGASSGNPTYKAASPPDLSFTTLKYAAVESKVLPASETFWNLVLLATIRAAAKRGATTTQIADKLLANHVIGLKDDGGYKHLPDLGLSVQGQDANAAWKATSNLAIAFGIPVEVKFTWQNNSKAAHPNEAGEMTTHFIPS